MRCSTLMVVLAATAALGCGSSGNSSSAAGSGNDGGGTGDAAADDGGGKTDGGGDDGGTDGGTDGAADGSVCHIGNPCNTSGADPKCGTGPHDTCNDQTNDGFPGGYCSYEPCSASALCPSCASCAHLGGESDACFKNCATDSDCRAPDYGCFDISPLFTSGPSHKVCYLKTFACGSNADCPAIKPTCSVADGGNGVCQ